jgi:hypothetical protein
MIRPECALDFPVGESSAAPLWEAATLLKTAKFLLGGFGMGSPVQLTRKYLELIENKRKIASTGKQ